MSCKCRERWLARGANAEAAAAVAPSFTTHERHGAGRRRVASRRTGGSTMAVVADGGPWHGNRFGRFIVRNLRYHGSRRSRGNRVGTALSEGLTEEARRVDRRAGSTENCRRNTAGRHPEREARTTRRRRQLPQQSARSATKWRQDLEPGHSKSRHDLPAVLRTASALTADKSRVLIAGRCTSRDSSVKRDDAQVHEDRRRRTRTSGCPPWW